METELRLCLIFESPLRIQYCYLYPFSVRALTHILLDILHSHDRRLLLAGLVGFYVRQSEAAGRLGLIGFASAFFGTALVEGEFYANTFVTPMVAQKAPAFLESPLSGFLQVWLPFSFGLIAFSWLLLAVATVRVSVYPRIASWFLLVGAAMAVLPIPLTNLPFETALAWMGFVLLTTRDAPPPRSKSDR